jgi:hypothetical protein
VRAKSALKVYFLATTLCAGFAVAALAQDAGEPQQIAPVAPPALPENPLPGTPSSAPAPQTAAPSTPTDLQACLQESGDYVTHGKTVDYVIGITNTCEERLRCEIFANVTGVKGSSLGHAVMILGPASSGTRAKKTYIMPVKSAGGITQVSRECKVL